MKLLATATQINSELARLLRECSSCQVAVAWASVGFEAFDLLVKHGDKIERMVVGTHFYQTHPAFIERFLTHPNVRFVVNTDGVFHPKVYLFEKADGEWECIIGSPNFTKGGFGQNAEMAMLVAYHDKGAQHPHPRTRPDSPKRRSQVGRIGRSRREQDLFPMQAS